MTEQGDFSRFKFLGYALRKHALVIICFFLALCFVILGFILLRTGDKRIVYNATAICPDAFEQKFDFSDYKGNSFSVPLKQGCFGGVVNMPKAWHSWHTQPTGDQKGFWSAIWIVGQRQGVGPMNANDNRDFQYTKARFQGHGIILFYTNDVPATSSDTPKSSPTPASYQERFCDDNTETKIESDSLVITLKEGCFAGAFVITGQFYNVDKTQNEGDWAAMWCNGREHPSKVHPAYEDFGDTDFRNCSKFYLQGKGTVHITRLK
jgi:hypothetical protein